jgi:hypothetical protein
MESKINDLHVKELQVLSDFRKYEDQQNDQLERWEAYILGEGRSPVDKEADGGKGDSGWGAPTTAQMPPASPTTTVGTATGAVLSNAAQGKRAGAGPEEGVGVVAPQLSAGDLADPGTAHNQSSDIRGDGSDSGGDDEDELMTAIEDRKDAEQILLLLLEAGE